MILEFFKLMGNLMPKINGTLGTIINKEGVDWRGFVKWRYRHHRGNTRGLQNKRRYRHRKND